MPRGNKGPYLKPAWWIAYGVVCGLGAAGLVLLLAAPRRGKPIELVPAPTRQATSTSEVTEVPIGDSATVFPININTATIDQLDQLPGVGPTLAQSIVAYRESNGPFETLDDLQNVPGIGPRTFEAIRPFITLEDG
ncbi:MAG: helix-hairpin-helix domain-containing protein [Anaerolineales bacterium]